jgi:hypothetical protein
VFIYLNKGQGQKQQDNDKYECYGWAKQQTGFDPMVQPEIENIPRFLKVNFKNKTISATEESGREDTSRIKNIERVNGNLILQGSENGRGWTMVISEETGKISATVSDEQAGFVVFGASTTF